VHRLPRSRRSLSGVGATLHHRNEHLRPETRRRFAGNCRPRFRKLICWSHYTSTTVAGRLSPHQVAAAYCKMWIIYGCDCSISRGSAVTPDLCSTMSLTVPVRTFLCGPADVPEAKDDDTVTITYPVHTSLGAPNMPTIIADDSRKRLPERLSRLYKQESRAITGRTARCILRSLKRRRGTAL